MWLCMGASLPRGAAPFSLAVLRGEKALTKICFTVLLEEEFLSQTTNSARLGIPGFRGNPLGSELSGIFPALGGL